MTASLGENASQTSDQQFLFDHLINFHQDATQGKFFLRKTKRSYPGNERNRSLLD